MTITYNGPQEIIALIDQWNDEMRAVICDSTGIRNIKNDLANKIQAYTAPLVSLLAQVREEDWDSLKVQAGCDEEISRISALQQDIARALAKAGVV